MNQAFCKWHALGNDFILVEADPVQELVQAIPSLCHRRYGIGADGFIILEMTNKLPKIHFYNQDGSQAKMCGNGLRCALMHLFAKGQKPEVEFSNHTYRAFFEDDRMFVNMPYPKLKNTFHDPYLGVLVEAGVPHFLVEKQDCHEGSLSKEVFENRYHPNFDTEGSNITFYEKKQGKYFIRTCERGVDEETYACGSAACAVALIAEEDHLEVVYPQGQSAFVKKNQSSFALAGEATLAFVGVFEY